MSHSPGGGDPDDEHPAQRPRFDQQESKKLRRRRLGFHFIGNSRALKLG
jgi:hypothetical protein